MLRRIDTTLPQPLTQPQPLTLTLPRPLTQPQPQPLLAHTTAALLEPCLPPPPPCRNVGESHRRPPATSPDTPEAEAEADAEAEPMPMPMARVAASHRPQATQ